MMISLTGRIQKCWSADFSSLWELTLETFTIKAVIKTKMNKITILSILHFSGRSIRAI